MLQKLDFYGKVAFREQHPSPWAASVGGRGMVFHNALESNRLLTLISGVE